MGKRDVFWNKRGEMLDGLMADGDLDNFISWPIIQENFSCDENDETKKEHEFVSSGDTLGRWKNGMNESEIGHPKKVSFEKTSAARINNLYTIKILESYIGKPVSSFGSIVEIFGGYGDMCYASRMVGFPGIYYIADIPSFCRLQSVYLMLSKMAKNVNWLQIGDDGKVEKFNADICLSTSIGKENKDRKDQLLESIVSGSVCFRVPLVFDGADNKAYFDKYGKRYKYHQWISSASPFQSYFVATNGA